MSEKKYKAYRLDYQFPKAKKVYGKWVRNPPSRALLEDIKKRGGNYEVSATNFKKALGGLGFFSDVVEMHRAFDQTAILEDQEGWQPVEVSDVRPGYAATRPSEALIDPDGLKATIIVKKGLKPFTCYGHKDGTRFYWTKHPDMKGWFYSWVRDAQDRLVGGAMRFRSRKLAKDRATQRYYRHDDAVKASRLKATRAAKAHDEGGV